MTRDNCWHDTVTLEKNAVFSVHVLEIPQTDLERHNTKNVKVLL